MYQTIDLKQWTYCPRVFYYQRCLPRIRPTTYLMDAGIAEGKTAEGREKRRSLQTYGLTAGTRHFNVPLRSDVLGLTGEADLVIETQQTNGVEWIPVDYKLSRKVGKHFKLQLTAYAMMLEEMHAVKVQRAFIYLIPLRKATAVNITTRLRNELSAALKNMRLTETRQQMPPPTAQLRKCQSCEFRRFCNDIAI